MLLRVPEGVVVPERDAGRRSTVEDTWILSRLQAAKARRSPRRSRRFEFHRAAHAIYDFVYGELCDWYLEMIKPRLYAEDNADDGASSRCTCCPRRSRWRTR